MNILQYICVKFGQTIKFINSKTIKLAEAYLEFLGQAIDGPCLSTKAPTANEGGGLPSQKPRGREIAAPVEG